MKKLYEKLCSPKIYKLCTFCLALTIIMRAKHASFLFFGEPKMPTE